MPKTVVTKNMRVALGHDQPLLRRINDEILRERAREARRAKEETLTAEEWYEEHSRRERERMAGAARIPPQQLELPF